MSVITESRETTPLPGGPGASGQAAILQAWDAHAAERGFRPSTRKNYRYRIVHFLHWLDAQGVALQEVSPALLASYLDGHSTCAHGRILCQTPLRRLFDLLAARQIVSHNPTRTQPAPAVGLVDEPAAFQVQVPPSTLAGLNSFLHVLGFTDEQSEWHRPGLVAMYPVVVGGMDASEIARFTRIPLPEVELYVRRLRENGIWTPDDKIQVDFDDPGSDEAVLNFILIIGCAKGVFARSEDPVDEERQEGAGTSL